MSDISVIIVNWNSKEFVIKCLDSLLKFPCKLELQIIVVDSASFDGCEELLAERYPNVIYVQLEQNLGFGHANNEGLKYVSSEFLWLLNPDTVVVGDAASELLTVITGKKDIGLVGAHLLNSDGSLQTTCVQSLPTPLNQAFDSENLRQWLGIWGMKAFRSDVEPVEVEAVSGASMLMRTSEFREIGGFDSRYFMYCEDMDLCLCIRKRGLRIYYVPAAKIYHHGGGSSNRQVSKFAVVMMREALVTYFSKNSGKVTVGIYRLLICLSAATRIAVISAKNLMFPSAMREKTSSLKKWTIILSWCFGRERLSRSLH